MNFVFRDHAHSYIGTAGHCMGGAALGQRVAAPNVGQFGTLVFRTACPAPTQCGAQPLTDDFALVRIDDDKGHLVNPAVRGFNRPPTGYATADSVALGQRVVLHGHGPFFAAEPGRTEYGVLESADEFEWVAQAVAPPGFSGAPVVRQSDGMAVGVVITHRHPSAVPDQVDRAAPLETQVFVGGPTVERVMQLLRAAGFDLRLVTRRAAARPVRSGTIAAPVRPTYGLGPIAGCGGSVDCLAWKTACPHRLPQARLGATASIVPVKSLAGSERPRLFKVVPGPATIDGVTVEFWSASCTPVRADRAGLDHVTYARFAIPDEAVWMTVTSPCTWICMSVSGVALRWELW